MKKWKQQLEVVLWAIRLAVQINGKVLFLWLSISIIAAILPAVSLHFNRASAAILSAFLTTGQGEFSDIVPSLVGLGVTMVLIGASNRINQGFLYLVMYDDYYLGFAEYLMDHVQKVELKTLMDKDYADSYQSSVGRAGALSDLLSTACMIVSRCVTIISLLIVALELSFTLFAALLIYVGAVMILYGLKFRASWMDSHRVRAAEREADYWKQAVLSPGVAKEIRIYNSSNLIIKQWKKASEKVQTFYRARAMKKNSLALVGAMGSYLCTATMVVFCIFGVAQGRFHVDVFLMLYTLGEQLFAAFQEITVDLIEAGRGLLALGHQYRFTHDTPANRRPSELKDEVVASADTIFEAKNVSFSYDGNKNALEHVSFQIKKGETIALVGPNGSGKTTLVKLLTGLFSPDSGELFFCEKPYTEYTSGDISSQIGMSFQDYYIFHLSMRENVGFGDLKNMKYEEKVLRAIEKGGAQKILKKLGGNLEGRLLRNTHRDGLMLSGGEKQRVAAARAHMNDRPILIFDEPAAALDPIAEMEQFLHIKEKVEGRTAILISHRVGFARMADRIFTLQDGHLIEVGTHDELMQRNGVYADFFASQAQWYREEAVTCKE